MVNVQKQFQQFHDAIRLRRYHENATLAEKRERILRTLSDGIERLRDEGREVPGYRIFNQGSYDLGVGTKPLDGDFDIDVGVAFELSDLNHSPLEVKNWVFNAVENHTQRVEIRRSCVTVFYQAAGEPIYHVDLAVYADIVPNGGQMYIARAFANSKPEDQSWSRSDPEGLTRLIGERFSGEDKLQFRRVVRFLKRWKDVNFPKDGNAAPRGIALTVSAYLWFVPRTTWVDGSRQRDDLDALRNLVGAMLERFSARLAVRCPAEPFDDLCSRMSDAQMDAYRAKLNLFFDALRDAADDVDPHSACATLAEQFGDDFPVPSPEDSGKRQGRAITNSGSSA